MLELLNRSDWAAELFPVWDRAHREALAVVVKARFGFDAEGQLWPLPAPAIEPADRHEGDPVESGVLRAGEAVAFKDSADCFFHGTVHPMRPTQRAREVLVAVESDGGRFTKRLRVTGRRRWKKSLFGLVPGDAEALEPTPLSWSYAFGGVDKKRRELEHRNPAGMGFSESRRDLRGQELPRIEYVDQPITRWSQRPRPAGLGPVAIAWQPRRRLAKQLDGEAAARGACPYPAEPPPGLFNAAPEDQRLAQPITGGERVYLHGFGVAHGGMITLELPRLAPKARVMRKGAASPVEFTCDTLEVDADAATLDLVCRGTVAAPKTDPSAGWVIVTAPQAEAA